MATIVDRKKDYKEAYDQASAGFGAWQMQVKKDYKVYLGDPWTSEDRLRFIKEQREAMSFPLLRRIVKWIAGYQRENILSIKYDPVENADQVTADQLTECAINLINVYNDRNYDTQFDRFGYNQFLLDPTFSRIDLHDCNYGMIRKYITKDEAKMLLPGKEATINKIKDIGKDNKFPYYPKPQLYGDFLLSFDEFQQRTAVERKVIILKPTNQELIWKGSKRELNEFIRK